MGASHTYISNKTNKTVSLHWAHGGSMCKLVGPGEVVEIEDDCIMFDQEEFYITPQNKGSVSSHRGNTYTVEQIDGDMYCFIR